MTRRDRKVSVRAKYLRLQRVPWKGAKGIAYQYGSSSVAAAAALSVKRADRSRAEQGADRAVGQSGHERVSEGGGGGARIGARKR